MRTDPVKFAAALLLYSLFYLAFFLQSLLTSNYSAPSDSLERASLTARLRHYHGLDRMLPRLRRLLTEFRFAAVRDVFPELTSAEARRPTVVRA